MRVDILSVKITNMLPVLVVSWTDVAELLQVMENLDEVSIVPVNV